MKLVQVDINQNKNLQKQVKRLYVRAFPKEERIPWWMMRLNAYRSGIDLTAFLDGGTFCGFTSSVTAGDLHFLLFFAVDEKLRGKGYGSAILSQLQQTHKRIVLNVEPLDESASNYPERVNRFAFYRKNGFVDTGYHVWEIGGMFRVLGTQPELDVAGYKKIFKKLTGGIWNVKIVRAEK